MYLFSVKRCGLDVITNTVISTHCWTERKTQFGRLKKILKKTPSRDENTFK